MESGKFPVVRCRGRRPRRPVDSLQISGHHRRPHLPCRGEACLARPRSGSSTANSVRCTVPIAMPQILPASMALTTRKGHAASVRRQSRQRLRSERRYRRNWLVCFIGSLYGLQVPSRDCHVGLRPPRNDKPLPFTVLLAACIGRRHCAGRDMSLPYNARPKVCVFFIFQSSVFIYFRAPPLQTSSHSTRSSLHTVSTWAQRGKRSTASACVRA